MERSDSAFWRWSESAEKFDYYLCGLVAAVAAFALRDLQPGTIGWSPYTIKLVSILFLLLGVGIGLKRIEATNQLKLIQHQQLYAQEKIGKLNDPRNPGPIYNQATGEGLSVQSKVAEIRRSAVELKVLEELAELQVHSAGSHYSWRNRLFVVGVLGLLVAKLWAGYDPYLPR